MRGGLDAPPRRGSRRGGGDVGCDRGVEVGGGGSTGRVRRRVRLGSGPEEERARREEEERRLAAARRRLMLRKFKMWKVGALFQRWARERRERIEREASAVEFQKQIDACGN